MTDMLKGTDRREFFRYTCEKPIHYSVLDSAKGKKAKELDALSKNLSVSGILFNTRSVVPGLSSILALELDYRTSKICQEIEEHVVIKDNKLYGKVVRIEENKDGSYDVGVAFLKK